MASSLGAFAATWLLTLAGGLVLLGALATLTHVSLGAAQPRLLCLPSACDLAATD